MTRRLFWKLCLIIGTGVVAMFYLINVAVNHFENDMSMLSDSSREELINWQKKAEVVFDQGDMSELERWVDDLQQQENIWAVIAKANVVELAGNRSHRHEYTGYNLGRSILSMPPLCNYPLKMVQLALLCSCRKECAQDHFGI